MRGEGSDRLLLSLVPRPHPPISGKRGLVTIDAFLGPNTFEISENEISNQIAEQLIKSHVNPAGGLIRAHGNTNP